MCKKYLRCFCLAMAERIDFGSRSRRAGTENLTECFFFIIFQCPRFIMLETSHQHPPAWKGQQQGSIILDGYFESRGSLFAYRESRPHFILNNLLNGGAHLSKVLGSNLKSLMEAPNSFPSLMWRRYHETPFVKSPIHKHGLTTPPLM